MSDHIEWGDAGTMTARIEILTPAEADERLFANDEAYPNPVLVLDTGSSLVALEGTPEQIIALGQAIVRQATAYREAHDTTEADPWSVDPITPARGGR